MEGSGGTGGAFGLPCFAGFLAYFKRCLAFGGCGPLARRGKYVMLRITLLVANIVFNECVCLKLVIFRI